MKSLRIYAVGIDSVVLAGALGISCKKSFDEKVPGLYGNENTSILQVYMAIVGPARNYVYVDSKPVNGASMVWGSVFPTTGYGFTVPGGVRAFLVKDTATSSTQVPLSFAENLQAGKNYTVFVYDTTTAPKQKTVETPIVVPSDTSARIRFANFIYSTSAIPPVDIYSKRQNKVIFNNVVITGVTDFIPYPSGLTDTFYVRNAGSPNNLQNFRPATMTVPAEFVDISLILTPTTKRSYTIVYRGGAKSTGTTNGTVRTLSAFANY
jgi:hypothetical protein